MRAQQVTLVTFGEEATTNHVRDNLHRAYVPGDYVLALRDRRVGWLLIGMIRTLAGYVLPKITVTFDPMHSDLAAFHSSADVTADPTISFQI